MINKDMLLALRNEAETEAQRLQSEVQQCVDLQHRLERQYFMKMGAIQQLNALLEQSEELEQIAKQKVPATPEPARSDSSWMS